MRFSDLSRARRQAGRSERHYYVFETRFEDVSLRDFPDAWRASAGRLLKRTEFAEPPLFLDLQASRYFRYGHGVIFMVGLAGFTGTGPVLRQILLSAPRFHKPMIEYVIAELGSANLIVGDNISGGDMEFLEEACYRETIPFDTRGLVILDLGRLSSYHLGDNQLFRRNLAALLPSGRKPLTPMTADDQFKDWCRTCWRPVGEDQFDLRAPRGRARDAMSAAARILLDNRLRILAMIQSLNHICRAVQTPEARSARVLQSDARSAALGKDWPAAVKLYQMALSKARDPAERNGIEMKLSLALRRLRRFVEALEIWNRLAEQGVNRAVHELVRFYEQVDPDPRKIIEIADRFAEKLNDPLDYGRLKYKQVVGEARLKGESPPGSESEFIERACIAHYGKGLVAAREERISPPRRRRPPIEDDEFDVLS